MKTFIMIPTYNEKENIEQLIDQILRLNINNLNIAVVDDDSPDKTWEIVQDIAKKNKIVHLIIRKGKRGRGLAGKEGFLYCLKKGADIVIEMDADFSHDPKYIPIMLREIRNHDIILGSRKVKGGKEINRGAVRRLITTIANLYIRMLLGIKVMDTNSGFRCFNRRILEKVAPTLESSGPSIVQEVLFKSLLKNAKIKEIPITFINRKKGKSKLGLAQLAAGYFMVLRLKLMRILGEI